MTSMPYSSESPPSQSRRPSQSGAAARVTDWPSRSESVVTPSDSLNSWVTKKALVSVAGDRSRSSMPASSSSEAPSEASCSPSPASNGSALAPLAWVLRKLTMPPTYSGTMSTSPGKVGM